MLDFAPRPAVPDPGRLKVIVDGLPYESELHHGIRRYINEILRRLTDRVDLRVQLDKQLHPLPGGVTTMPASQPSGRLNRMVSRIFRKPERQSIAAADLYQAVFREVAGDAALYFDPRLGERLAETVALALEPLVRRRLIDAGLENVRRFSWKAAADRTLAVWEEAVEIARS
ncbi:MAG TPA: hypothetical protein VM534_03335 [Thermoanaerobaculia bacterium]|nr:hypothetical protein [Thermoanaerobaculia bacterium]